MREMLSPTSAIMGKGLGKEVALITDGRFSGGSHGFVVGHITPEAYTGGTIALIKNGDTITIDAEKRQINLEIPAAELKQRQKAWKAPKPRYPPEIYCSIWAMVASCEEIVQLTRSPIEMMPTSSAFCTTGRWRTRCSVIKRMQSATVSSGVTVTI